MFLLALDLFIDSCDAFKREGILGVGTLLFLGLLCLHPSLVVVAQVTSLAHSDGVVESFLVLAFPSKLVAAEFPVARRTHVFSVVFSVDMRTLRNFHSV